MRYLTGCLGPKVRPLVDDGTLGALVTPATRYTVRPGWVWAADNGCFNSDRYVGDEKWLKWLNRQPREGCLFATAPDVVADWTASLARSRPFLEQIRGMGFPVALVAQDGATPDTIPFEDFDVLFIGGSDQFKLHDSLPVIQAAHDRGVPVHVGRINSKRRYQMFAHLGVASCDGTFLAFGPDINIPKLLRWFQ